MRCLSGARREAASPESITPAEAMDSGLATFGGAPEWPSRAYDRLHGIAPL